MRMSKTDAPWSNSRHWNCRVNRTSVYMNSSEDTSVKLTDLTIVEKKSEFFPLERNAILSVLEECSDALAIYQHTLKKPVTNINIGVDHLLQRYSHCEKKQLLSHDPSATLRDIENQAAFHKLQKDSLYAKKLLDDTKDEMREYGCFAVLSATVETIKEKNNNDKVLLRRSEEMSKAVANLRRILKTEAETNSQEEERCKERLRDIRNEMDTLEITADAELRYLDAWERSRCEQMSLRCKMSVESMRDDLKNCLDRKKKECRVNEEIVRYLLENISLNENQITYWQQRYDTEAKTYETEICQLRSEIETRQELVGKLKEEFLGKQEFIDAYLAEKEAIRKRREREEHERTSAIKIQAWWRGVMVRRKLGPYRPEEKRKKRAVKTKK
ncbi:dynein regulatory complex protein 9 isoform X2 [Cephus cinctus]|uniref:Dynein regulatory complex protein 9 n=1 Tax=Cephus cinctus TaxID=211228 RepID=A0AAJ7RRY3_CEPCN|nr:dynein regulatory complex protein 9 isoform X2 [Cephus cinctus]